MKWFDQLTESEILALAISSEEEDGRIYAETGWDGLGQDHPDTSQVFSDMAAEESEHRRRLIDLYVSKFGNHIPLVRRQDVRGFVYMDTPPVSAAAKVMLGGGLGLAIGILIGRS